MLNQLKTARVAIYELDKQYEGFNKILIELLETDNSYFAYLFEEGSDVKLLVLSVPRNDEGMETKVGDFLKSIKTFVENDDVMMENLQTYNGLKNFFESDIDDFGFDDDTSFDSDEFGDDFNFEGEFSEGSGDEDFNFDNDSQNEEDDNFIDNFSLND